MTLDPRAVALALGGSATGRSVVAPGPGHTRTDRSLSIKIDATAPDGFLVHSFAGDSPIACRDYVRAALWLGAWERPYRQSSRWQRRSVVAGRDDTANRSALALRLWDAARDPRGTMVANYLGSRGLQLQLPPALRFYGGLKHPSGGCWPTMVALVTRGSDNTPLAIHRTFLALDGVGKAPVDPQRMILGPSRGGVVRLGVLHHELLVGEGIETVLAAMQATGIPGWAALSTSGLRALDLPVEAQDIAIIADGDDAGEAAAQYAAQRWADQGRSVRIARPPRGMDFNDLLRAGT